MKGRELTKDKALCSIYNKVQIHENMIRIPNAEKLGIKSWGCIDYLVSECGYFLNKSFISDEAHNKLKVHK